MNLKHQIFTPKPYVIKMLNALEYRSEKILGKYILENSCGQGIFLIEIVRRYILEAKKLNYDDVKIKKELEIYIIGFEVDSKVLNICIKNLNEEALKYGITNVNWNIKNEDYLKFEVNKKVDYIIGNPPYIMYQDLNIQQREFLRKNFLSCVKGKFDYYYAFIEKSVNELKSDGKMTYIIPSSMFKNVFGKELRSIILNSLFKIYDYKESSVFGNNILTSPAIICLNMGTESKVIKYHDLDNNHILLINKKKLNDKWVFKNEKKLKKMKSTKRLGDFFKVSNSVATLLNEAYIINKKDILYESEYLIKIKEFYLEKEILRPAASLRNYSINRGEYIIFPYEYKGKSLRRFEEIEFKEKFPGAYKYLKSFSEKLNKRKSDKSAKWFEYGRNQALTFINQEKILLSSIITNEVKFYNLDALSVPYSGFYITPIGNKSLEDAKKIFASEEFLAHVMIRGINANGKSIRLSVNDVMDYPLEDVNISNSLLESEQNICFSMLENQSLIKEEDRNLIKILK